MSIAPEVAASYLQAFPDLYIRHYLGMELTPDQVKIARALTTHRRVLVHASHGVGKSEIAASLVNWMFDSHYPANILTTAPSEQQVDNVLWRKIRRQRNDAVRRGKIQKSYLQPKASLMSRDDRHFAVGITARSAEAFQGRHEENQLIIFDEAIDVDGVFWDAAESMMIAEGCRWLAIFNPTDPTTHAYSAAISGRWHCIRISAFNHPNVIAGLEGRPLPFPGAVTAEWITEQVGHWATPISPSDRNALDVEWPPASGNWCRPGPLFESRVLGLWPSQATNAVWSDAMLAAMDVQKPVPEEPLQIGCDVAYEGDDNTSIVVQRGGVFLHHESHNGWPPEQVAGRLKLLAGKYANPGEDPKGVRIKVDRDGPGRGVMALKDGWNFIAISAASGALQKQAYPNVRSELWFNTAEAARNGKLDWTRLSDSSRFALRSQAMSPCYKVNSRGQMEVEPKQMTKKRIGRSPDDMDAFNLSTYSGGWWQDRSLIDWMRTQ